MFDEEPRVLVIALHEATLDLAGPWAAEGTLPTFRRLIEKGLSGRLRSRFPFFGPERWGNLVTGQDANHHGLTEYVQRDRSGNFAPIRYGRRYGAQVPPVWKLLSQRGIPCGVVNAPLAYPEDVPRGFVIQEMLDAFAWCVSSKEGWRRRMAKPVALHDALEKHFGSMEISVHNVDKDNLIPLLEAQVERQCRVLSFLLQQREWRFCLTRLTQIADAQHYLWGDHNSADPSNLHRDGIKRIYQAVDRALAALLDTIGPNTSLLVVSDCGAGPLRSGVQVNTWLANEGFLRWASAPAPGQVGARLESNDPDGGLRVLARQLLPKPVHRSAARVRQTFLSYRRRKKPNTAIDWAQTTAYAVGVETGIAINLRGREPGGIVKPGTEYRDVCDRVIARLMALVDPNTGEPAVDRVHRASELYAPGIAARAPDLCVEWRGAAYLPSEIEDVPGAVFVSHRQRGKMLPNTGAHRADGLLLAMGRGLLAGERRDGSVFDVVPTCFHLLEQPFPPGLKGQSLVKERA